MSTVGDEVDSSDPHPAGHVSRVVAALLATAAVVYAAWVGELLLAWGDLDPVTSYVSELSAAGEPASGMWRAVYALAGALVALVSVLALWRGRGRLVSIGPGRWRRRRSRSVGTVASTASTSTAAPSALPPESTATPPLSPWPAIGWWALLVFGVATVLDAANPLSCAATADAACAAREAIGDVPLSHRIHTYTSSIAGAALLVAIVVLIRVGIAERVAAAPFLLLAAGGYLVGTVWTLAEIARVTPWSSLLGIAQRAQLIAGSAWLLAWALSCVRTARIQTSSARTPGVTGANT